LSGGIGLRGEYEKDFVILMIEFAEGNEVLLEAGGSEPRQGQMTAVRGA